MLQPVFQFSLSSLSQIISSTLDKLFCNQFFTSPYQICLKWYLACQTGYFATSLLLLPINFVPNGFKNITYLGMSFCNQFFSSPYHICLESYETYTQVILQPILQFSLSNLSQKVSSIYIGHFATSFFSSPYQFFPMKHIHRSFCNQFFSSPYQLCPKSY